jgi:site-specific DNA-methyltransferase (adenine-specific)
MLEIAIDPEFKSVIPPLDKEEYRGLTEDIVADGCRESIVVWNKTIIDGHNRYSICKENNIPFTTIDYSSKFQTRDEVIDWMLRNQLNKRNLKPDVIAYLRGEQYNRRKHAHGGERGNQYTKMATPQSEVLATTIPTASTVAKEQGVGHATVERDAAYNNAVKNVVQTVGMDSVKQKILDGTIKAARKDIIELAKATPEVQKEIITKSLERETNIKTLLNEEKRQQRNEDRKAKSGEFQRANVQLYNKDCFDILPSIESGSIDMILADLPYGQTACDWDSVLPLDKLWEQYKRIIKDNGVIVLTATHPFTWKLCESNPEWFKYEIIWEKPNGTNPLTVKLQPFRVHENILVFYKKQPTYNPQMLAGKPYNGYSSDTKTIGEIFSGSGDDNRGLISRHRENPEGTRYPRSVIRCKQDRSGHPTKKPVELMSWIIKTYTNPGETVLDNTMGEGTTGVACVQENRKFVGIELEKKYYDVAVESIKITGGL